MNRSFDIEHLLFDIVHSDEHFVVNCTNILHSPYSKIVLPRKKVKFYHYFDIYLMSQRIKNYICPLTKTILAENSSQNYTIVVSIYPHITLQ